MSKGERAILYLVAFSLVALMATTLPSSFAAMNKTASYGQLVHEATRACTPATGAPVLLDATTGADDDSGALDPLTVYRLHCDTDAWCDFGTAATDAAADDTKIVGGIPEYFFTSTDVLHVSCKSVSSDGDCRLTKCL